MKKFIFLAALSTSISGCIVSGHPSTDIHHSHVDTSETRYDKYDPDYTYHDETQPLKNRRVYEDSHKQNDDETLDGYYDDDGHYAHHNR